jgi:AraC-like DNA-binding protein
MEDFIVKAVERVIRTMQDNLGEPITIDDMARTAMFSKFHFSRMFQRVTGISPGRFLSALRLQEAKRLLLTSSLTVADISHLVGYNSIGTFSSRFRISVGVSPTTYRQYDGFVDPLDEHPHRDSEQSVIRGHVHHAAATRPGHIVMGVFPDRIAQGLPVRHTTLDTAGEFTIAGVPNGTWHLIARSVGNRYGGPVATDEVYVAALGPLTVARGASLRPVDMWLRPRVIFDPPALLAQLDETMLARNARAPGRVEEPVLPGA